MAQYGGRVHYSGWGELNRVSGVASTLPAGLTLGDKQEADGVTYRCAYNAGNSAGSPGMGLYNTQAIGIGLYSVTITTVTEAVTGMVGAIQHSTVPTGYYFWMATEGHPVRLMASNISLATGAQVGPAAAGKWVTTDTLANVCAINVGDAASATATTDAVPTAGRFKIFFESKQPGIDILSS